MMDSDYDKTTPCGWAIAIYTYLQCGIEENYLKSWMETSKRRYMFCRCKVEKHACCMKRNLILAMTRKILQWLHDNEAQLQDIDYADRCRDYSDVTTTVCPRSDARSYCCVTESDRLTSNVVTKPAEVSNIRRHFKRRHSDADIVQGKRAPRVKKPKRARSAADQGHSAATYSSDAPT